MTDSGDLTLGYISLVISCISFAFMFAPLRKFDCRDGFFVQWVQCSVVFLFGIGINVARGLPPFNLTAAIGGVLYATGNIFSVPIVKGIGIGVGMLIWGSVQITVGWCIARFGLFGTHVQKVSNDPMNYAGVILTLLSGIIFVFVKNESGDSGSYDLQSRDSTTKIKSIESMEGHFKQKSSDEEENYYATVRSVGETKQRDLKLNGKKTEKEKRKFGLSPKKLFYVFLSICLGLLHGAFLTPIVYVQDNDPQASSNVLDYVFSHFSAAFTFSTIYFLLYAVFKRNKPYVEANLVLPSAIYGVLWSIGMTLFFISNHKLSQTVSFPITARLPAVLGALTDVAIFRSIKGAKNLLFLFTGVLIGVTGVILVGLSNEV
ncbi:hypothetical protein FO519_004929 [Halicephalobus sp. NKZ332]|nr:hypothetical protein FO519_004929 [Halicephalobus sp. NKZ332]